MVFGSDVFFERLKAGVEAGDIRIYDELNDVVDRDLRGKVRSKTPAADLEDVMQEIKLTVWKRLAGYIRAAQRNTPAQRGAWLSGIANSRMVDHYRKNHVRLRRQAGPEEARMPGGAAGPAWERRTVALNEDFQYDPTAPSLDEVLVEEVEREIDQKKCEQIIRFICTRKLSPERIITALYNIIILPLMAGRQSGAPQMLADRMEGKSLYEMRLLLARDMDAAFARPVQQETYEALDRKLEQAPDAVFDMSVREMTLVAHNARKAIREHRGHILGGDGR